MSTTRNCMAIIKSGARVGEVCNCQPFIYNPFLEEWHCKRHNKLNASQVSRINSTVLCTYEGGLRLGELDIDAAVAALKPDPIGEYNAKTLKGYINVKIGEPVLFEYLPLVFMSNLQGFGEHFDRVTLAKSLKTSLEYILSRPDIYAFKEGAGIDNVYLTRIWWSAYYGRFIADLEVRNYAPL